MKKTLYVYLLREQWATLTICLIGVSFILVTGQLFQLTRFFFATSCTLFDIVQVLLLALPRLLLFSFPMAALMGVMLAFVRLSGDNELIAFRAAGISFRQFLPPVVFILLVCTVVAFFNSFYAVPWANRAFGLKLRSLGRESLPALFKEGIFISNIPNLVLYFRTVEPSDLSIRGVLVQDQRQPKEKVTIVAEKAQIVIPPDSSLITFKIANGVITRIAEDLQNAQSVSFKDYDFSLALEDIFPAGKGPGLKRKHEMSIGELYHHMTEQKDKKTRIIVAMDVHQRVAFPAACLLMGLIGPPLGSMFRQRGRMTGVTIGIGVFLAYYVVLSAGKAFGENGLISPFFAIWTPNILCLAAGIVLWRKMQLEKLFFAPRLFWRMLFPRKQPLASHAAGGSL
jgi:lipopolysaccharide export system permease protein